MSNLQKILPIAVSVAIGPMLYLVPSAISAIRSSGGFSFRDRGGFRSEMNHREALKILNVGDYDTDTTLRERHRMLMRGNHPDMGGSPYLASKINEAKDMLLLERRQ